LVILYSFSYARAKVEPVGGFSHIMAHTMCFRQGRCFLGLRQYWNSFG